MLVGSRALVGEILRVNQLNLAPSRELGLAAGAGAAISKSYAVILRTSDSAAFSCFVPARAPETSSPLTPGRTVIGKTSVAQSVRV